MRFAGNQSGGSRGGSTGGGSTSGVYPEGGRSGARSGGGSANGVYSEGGRSGADSGDARARAARSGGIRTGGLFTAARRNFIRNLRRYRVLLLALILIVMALTAVLGTMLGLRGAVREKASRYFAGDLVVLGYEGTGNSRIEDPEAVAAAVEDLAAGVEDAGVEARGASDDSGQDRAAPAGTDDATAEDPQRSGGDRETGSAGPDPEGRARHRPVDLRTWSRRSTYYDMATIELFFAGYYTRQRRMVGVEWELERPVLENFEFAAGGVPEEGNETAILISTATARALGIGVGDDVVVSIRSDRGRTNTADFIVSGIYIESSFFGYTSYVHRAALNRLREAPEDRVNEIGVYLRDAGDEERAAAALTAALAAQGLPTFEVMTDRDAYSAESRRGRDRREYGVVTLGAQLNEINELLGAITIIAGVVMVLFLGIVTVGVSNTWTMVVWERTREIGTLRALGMQRTGTISLFLLEALFLGATGVILGSGLGVGLLAGIERWMSFEPNAFTTLFLTQGRLAWNLPWWGIAGISGLALGASLFGALRAAVRAGRVHPVEALRHEK
ncbi:MAG: FtsX-like permease family protein [Alkalispirochaeta sp.]